jgi:Zn-dependent M28 family amino/carboxypeptidase
MKPSSRPFSPAAAVAAVGLFAAVCCASGPKPQGVARDAGVDIGNLQKEIVAKLTGGAEIRPGFKIPNRAAAENKTEARTYLADLWKRLGLDVQAQDYSPEGRNIFALLPASRPSAEFVVVGAHYDSARNSPGANDDATGVALVTAAAAEMGRVPSRSRNMIFVLFDEEERGLRGSRAFAQKLKDENRVVHSVHTIDQMGWDADGDRAVELEIPYDGAVALYEKAAGAFPVPVPLLTTTEAGSDHSAFRKLGFPAVGLTEEYRHKDTTPHFHRPTDTFDTVDFAYLRSTTNLIVEVLKILTRSL